MAPTDRRASVGDAAAPAGAAPLPRARRRTTQCHALLIVAACVAVYVNAFDHAYNLDSPHGLLDNPYVRSLRHVPTYFTDPLTLTSNRANGDYRPILQITFALNHAVSGYRMWSWHLVQIGLHATCALALYLFCRRLFGPCRGRREDGAIRWAALAAALVFAVHPAHSGVVNYLWARSSLLVAAFLLPSLICYLQPGGSAAYERTPWRAGLLYTLALFTKVEAVAAVAVYYFYDALVAARLRRPRSQGNGGAGRLPGVLHDLLAALNRTTLRRMGPIIGVTLLYALVRISVMPPHLSAARSDLSAPVYFMTQLTTGWHYILRWLAPIELVADNLAYPVFGPGFRLPVLLAVTGWVLAAALLRGVYGRHPQYLFLALSALALISPTSSFMPLAEMVNEHRPYLPMALLSLCGLVPAVAGMTATSRAAPVLKIVWPAAVGMLCVCLGLMTLQRNLVFQTEERYWRDIQAKAPSSRSHLNYGRILMERGRIEEAIRLFDSALKMAPRWHVVHVNLALAHEARGRFDTARRHYDRAVEYDRYRTGARMYRGRFHLARGDYQRAFDDFNTHLPFTRNPFDTHEGLATACAGLGRPQECLAHTRRCLALDAARAERSITGISRPFWDAADLWRPGLDYYLALESDLPGRQWIQINIGRLAGRTGNRPVALRAWRRAVLLDDSRLTAVQAVYDEALRAQNEQADWEGSLALLEIVAEKAPAHAKTMFLIGFAHQKRGAARKAIDSYRRFLKIDEAYFQAHFNLAFAYMETGQYPAAVTHFRRTLELKPDYAEARRHLERCLAATGK